LWCWLGMACKTLRLIVFVGLLQGGLGGAPAIAQTSKPPTSSISQADFNTVCQLSSGQPTTLVPRVPNLSQRFPPLFPPLFPTTLPSGTLGRLMLFSVSDYLNQAQERTQKQDYAGAIGAYTQALRLNPYDNSLYENRAEAFVQMGDRQAALADYNKAVEYAPESGTFAREKRAKLKMQLQDWQGANEDFTFLINRSGKSVPSFFYRDRCTVRKAMGDTQGAIADYREYRQRVPLAQPNRNDLRLPLPPPIQLTPRRRNSQFLPPQATSSVAQPYPTSNEPEPTTTRGYFARGLSRLASVFSENWTGALSDFAQVSQREPEMAIAEYYKGLAQLRLGDAQGAIASFTKTLELDPSFTATYYSRAIAYLRLQTDPTAALAFEDLNRLIAQQPEAKEAYVLQSAAYLHLRKDTKAAQQRIDDLIWKLKVTPAEAYLNRAEVFEVLALPELAIADYTQVIERDPENLVAYRNRGRLQNQAGNCAAAQSDRQIAAKIEQRQYQRALQDYKRQYPGSVAFYPIPPGIPSLEFCAPSPSLPIQKQ